MRGTILGFDVATGTGAIAGADGRRYGFAAHEWRGGAMQPFPGYFCDFDCPDGVNAVQVYPVVAAPAAPPPYVSAQKSPIAAGLLAIFLGGWGAHKFYLGYSGEGAILLVASFLSFCLWIILVGMIGTMAIWVITVVEGVIYLTKSEAEFQRLYVDDRRPWF